MFSLMRSRRAEREPAPSLVPPVQPLAPDASQDLVALISRHASTMGREAAEVRGAIDDASKVATAQAQALHALADEVQQVTQAQSRITQRSRRESDRCDLADGSIGGASGCSRSGRTARFGPRS